MICCTSRLLTTNIYPWLHNSWDTIITATVDLSIVATLDLHLAPHVKQPQHYLSSRHIQSIFLCLASVSTSLLEAYTRLGVLGSVADPVAIF